MQPNVSPQTNQAAQPNCVPEARFMPQPGSALASGIPLLNQPQPANSWQLSCAQPARRPLPPILQRRLDVPTQGAVSASSGTPFQRRRTDQPGYQLQRGLTLVELLFTVAVAAVLCAVSLPSFSSVIASSKSRTASNALITGLNLARSTAISRRGDVVMCPSSDAKRCDGTIWWQYGWIVFQDLNHNSQRDADEPMLTATQLQTGIAIATTAGREHVTYRGEGTSAGTNLTFTLCDRRGPKFASTVVVSNPGRPRIGPATAAQAAAACAGL